MYEIVSEKGNVFCGSYKACLLYIDEHPELELTEDDIIEE